MGSQRSIRAFAPASVSNLACGFDVMGFAIEGLGDEIVALEGDEKGVRISSIEGDDGRLPRAADRNTAGVAVQALLEAAGIEAAIELRLIKHMPLSSGLGSSAASAVAAAVAVNELLELRAERAVLLRCAMAGEKAACGTAHPDNAAPSLHGGLVLIRHPDPADVIPLPVPEGLSCALVRPHVEVETRAARQLLGDQIPLRAAVAQWGNLGALVAGLFRGDLELIARALEDHIAEPVRAPLVPGFAAVQEAARKSGALGCSLSGSGPTIFALCESPETAEGTSRAMAEALCDAGIECDRRVSPVGAEGAAVRT